MKTRIVLVGATLILLFGPSLFAGPAPWWEWKSVTTGDIVCAQTPPGKDWVRYTGPYTDMKCSVRGETRK